MSAGLSSVSISLSGIYLILLILFVIITESPIDLYMIYLESPLNWSAQSYPDRHFFNKILVQGISFVTRVTSHHTESDWIKLTTVSKTLDGKTAWV